MTAEKRNPAAGYEAEQLRAMPVAGLAAKLLPVIARKKAASTYPSRAGSSYFYELARGWETRVLREDDEIVKVFSALELEDAFADDKVKAIMIPADAAVTREVALRICERYGRGKTVFLEVDNEKK